MTTVESKNWVALFEEEVIEPLKESIVKAKAVIDQHAQIAMKIDNGGYDVQLPASEVVSEIKKLIEIGETGPEEIFGVFFAVKTRSDKVESVIEANREAVMQYLNKRFRAAKHSAAATLSARQIHAIGFTAWKTLLLIKGAMVAGSFHNPVPLMPDEAFGLRWSNWSIERLEDDDFERRMSAWMLGLNDWFVTTGQLQRAHFLMTTRVVARLSVPQIATLVTSLSEREAEFIFRLGQGVFLSTQEGPRDAAGPPPRLRWGWLDGSRVISVEGIWHEVDQLETRISKEHLASTIRGDPEPGLGKPVRKQVSKNVDYSKSRDGEFQVAVKGYQDMCRASGVTVKLHELIDHVNDVEIKRVDRKVMRPLNNFESAWRQLNLLSSEQKRQPIMRLKYDESYEAELIAVCAKHTEDDEYVVTYEDDPDKEILLHRAAGVATEMMYYYGPEKTPMTAVLPAAEAGWCRLFKKGEVVTMVSHLHMVFKSSDTEPGLHGKAIAAALGIKKVRVVEIENPEFEDHPISIRTSMGCFVSTTRKIRVPHTTDAMDRRLAFALRAKVLHDKSMLPVSQFRALYDQASLQEAHMWIVRLLDNQASIGSTIVTTYDGRAQHCAGRGRWVANILAFMLIISVGWGCVLHTDCDGGMDAFGMPGSNFPSGYLRCAYSSSPPAGPKCLTAYAFSPPCQPNEVSWGGFCYEPRCNASSECGFSEVCYEGICLFQSNSFWGGVCSSGTDCTTCCSGNIDGGASVDGTNHACYPCMSSSSSTRTPTGTRTPSRTPSRSKTPTRTGTATRTSTPTGTLSLTPTATRTVSRTSAMTSTNTPSMSTFPSPSQTQTIWPSMSTSGAPGPSMSQTGSVAPTQSSTESVSQSQSITRSNTPTISAQPTAVFITPSQIGTMSPMMLPSESPMVTLHPGSAMPTVAQTINPTVIPNTTESSTPVPVVRTVEPEGHYAKLPRMVETSASDRLRPRFFVFLQFLTGVYGELYCIGSRLAKVFAERQSIGNSTVSVTGNYTYESTWLRGILDATTSGQVCNWTFPAVEAVVNEPNLLRKRDLPSEVPDYSSSGVFAWLNQESNAVVIKFNLATDRTVVVRCGTFDTQVVTTGASLVVSLPEELMYQSGTVTVTTYVMVEGQYIFESNNGFSYVGERPCVILDCWFCNMLNWDCMPTLAKAMAVLVAILIGLICIWVIVKMWGVIGLVFIKGFGCLGFTGRFLKNSAMNTASGLTERMRTVADQGKAAETEKERLRGADEEVPISDEAGGNIINWNGRRWLNVRGQLTLLPMVMMIFVGVALACDDSFMVSNSGRSCVTNSFGTTCQYEVDTVMSFRRPGMTACVNFEEDGVVLGRLEVTFSGNRISCDLTNGYWTSVFTTHTSSVFRCWGAGTCPDECAGVEVNGTTEIVDIGRGLGEQTCRRSVGGLSQGCLIGTPGCTYSGWRIIPNGPATYVQEISVCDRLPTFTYTLVDSDGEIQASGEIGVESNFGEDEFVKLEVLSIDPPLLPIDFPTHHVSGSGYTAMGRASPVNQPKAGMVGDIQSLSRDDLMNDTFIYDPQILTSITPKGKFDVFGFREPGLNAADEWRRMPGVYGGVVWGDNAHAGWGASQISSFDSRLSGTLLGLVSKGNLTLSRLSDLVCPEVEFKSLSGCRDCDEGAKADFIVRSSCMEGTVLVTGDGVVVSSVRLSKVEQVFTVVIRSDERNYDGEVCFGEVCTEVEGELMDALVLDQSTILYTGEKVEKSVMGHKSWRSWEWAIFGVSIGLGTLVLGGFVISVAIWPTVQGLKLSINWVKRLSVRGKKKRV